MADEVVVQDMFEGVLQYPNPLLLKPSAEITSITPEVIVCAEKMMKVFIDSPICCGLSAVQIGIPIRLIMVKNGPDILTLINPKIIKTAPKTFVNDEQCMSVNRTKLHVSVKRYKFVKVTATSMMTLKPVSYKAHDDFGATIQHEMDHLDGILINTRAKTI
jgi:peptide deformylase